MARAGARAARRVNASSASSPSSRPSRTTRSRCPGTRRCCCRPASGRARRRRAASARPARGAASRAGCAAAARAARATSGSSVGPSTPQFQERLSSLPSRLSSRFASLCLRVVGDEVGEREAVVGGDEVDRRGRVPAVVLVEVARAGEARGERGRVRLRRARSRASCRGTGRSTPSRAPGSCRPGSRPGPRSHGSAISFTRESTGSWWMTSKNAESRSTS